ncbi:hypothetical protein G6F31_011762 [Rhizopus arrhizus]|nr:hypothetical protein G6F31_011762 [Rhizopus arrhizus]
MLELAPMAQAPPVPPREVATGPLQQQQQRQAPTPAVREQPKAPVQPQGDLPPPKAPEPTPSPETADANVAQTSAPPQVAADAAARYTAPQTTAGERSRAEATWEGRLLGHLQKHRRYPRQAERLRQQGVVYVRFAVARDGAVSGLKLGRSSGGELRDQETLDTVQRASPAGFRVVAAEPIDQPSDIAARADVHRDIGHGLVGIVPRAVLVVAVPLVLFHARGNGAQRPGRRAGLAGRAFATRGFGVDPGQCLRQAGMHGVVQHHNLVFVGTLLFLRHLQLIAVLLR